jgi:hypothetical protein
MENINLKAFEGVVVANREMYTDGGMVYLVVYAGGGTGHNNLLSMVIKDGLNQDVEHPYIEFNDKKGCIEYDGFDVCEYEMFMGFVDLSDFQEFNPTTTTLELPAAIRALIKK